MDPATIATIAAGAVAALAPYLKKTGEMFAEEVGKKTFEKIASLYQAIKDRFKDQPAKKRTLKELEEMPEGQDVQAALCLQLEKQMTADVDFAEALRQLLNDVAQDEQGATFLTQVLGGEVGKIVSIGRARDLTF